MLIYARFLTVEVIQAVNSHTRSKEVRNFLLKVCSPPRAGQDPIKLVEKHTGRSLSSWHYFFVLTALLVYYFLMLTAFDGRRFDFDSPWIADVIRWTFIYTVVYWLQDLVSGSIIIDFKRRRETNLGYNMVPMVVLCLNLYVVGLIFWVSTKLHLHLESPWLICGLFLFIKHGMDLYLGNGGLITSKKWVFGNFRL